MQTENLSAIDASGAAVARFAGQEEQANATGVYTVECIGADRKSVV